MKKKREDTSWNGRREKLTKQTKGIRRVFRQSRIRNLKLWWRIGTETYREDYSLWWKLKSGI